MTKDHEWRITHGTPREIEDYLAAVARLEPEVATGTVIDLPMAAASIAISLKLIVNALEMINNRLEEIANK